MNKDLVNAIHRYAEDREIDYFAVQSIVESYTGKKITTQKELIEWKQKVDKYLKTFEPKDFESIEDDLNKMKQS